MKGAPWLASLRRWLVSPGSGAGACAKKILGRAKMSSDDTQISGEQSQRPSAILARAPSKDGPHLTFFKKTFQEVTSYTITSCGVTKCCKTHLLLQNLLHVTKCARYSPTQQRKADAAKGDLLPSVVTNAASCKRFRDWQAEPTQKHQVGNHDGRPHLLPS